MSHTSLHSHPPKSLDVGTTTPYSAGGDDSARRDLASDILARVTAEFREMPGLSVTLAQAARLFDVPREACIRLFDELRRQGEIEVTPDGRYRRPTGE